MTPLFSHRHIKPDGTGKCKFGDKIGAWAKSPCAAIYGSRPIVNNNTGGSTAVTTPVTWSKRDYNDPHYSYEVSDTWQSGEFQQESSYTMDENTTFTPSYLDRSGAESNY